MFGINFTDAQKYFLYGVLGVVIICLGYVIFGEVRGFNEVNIDLRDKQGDMISTSPYTQSRVVVHIAGEVKVSGLYTLEQGSRVNDAINAAGGPTLNADLDAINLAQRVCDGEKIDIPSKSEAQQVRKGVMPTSFSHSVTNVRSKVNINTASESELDTIPGVGPATAQKIIEHRRLNGPFGSLERIMDVSGIGEKKFENMKDYITY